MPNHRIDKAQALQASGSHHPHPERVRDALFQDHPFFDPRDLVQVKYEMLRCVSDESASVSDSSDRFGLSRTTYYAAEKAFASQGLAGLLPKRTGPRGAHKLTDELVAALRAAWQQHPRPSWQELAALAKSRWGLTVHPRSIQRVLSHEKKNR